MTLSNALARLRRGERQAFDEVYDHLRPRLYSFLVRLGGDPALAEDIVQDTFLQLASSARTLPRDTRLAPWLFTVARNRYLDLRRKGKLRATHREGQHVHQTATLSPLDELEHRQRREQLEQALFALPETQRELVLLTSVGHLKPAEICTMLGLRPATFRKRLSRARAALRTLLLDTPS